MELSFDPKLIPDSLGGYLAPDLITINVLKCNCDIDVISATIIHEYIHSILDRDESIATCRAFDNIAYSVHSRIAFDKYLYNPYRPIQTKFVDRYTLPTDYPHYI